MKVTIEEKSEELKFPCLMKATRGDLVVLFTNKDCGIVLAQGESRFSVGAYSESWSNFYERDVWQPLNGKVILEND